MEKIIDKEKQLKSYPSVSREEFEKMSYPERLKLFNEDPETYRFFTHYIEESGRK